MITQKALKKNLFAYYFSLFLLTVSTSLPHSVLTVLLLDKGLSLSQIMIVQAGYSLAIILFEYPSGVIADIYSRKKLFIYSKLFLIGLFGIVFATQNFFLIVFAWFIYGISNALDSGTIDAQIINDLKNMDNSNGIRKFVRYSNQLNFVSLILGSTLGSFLYFKIGISIYLISILFTIMSVSVVAIWYSNQSQTKLVDENISISIQSIFAQVSSGIKEMQFNVNLRYIVFFTAISQIFFQTHFQLWQAYFLSINISEKNFYVFYVIFQLISIIAYSIPFKNNVKKSKRSLMMAFISIISVIPIMLLTKLQMVSLVIYIIYIFIYNILDYVYNLTFAEQVSEDNISSLTSLKSTIGRLASIFTLVYSSLLLNYLEVKYVIIFNFMISSILSGATYMIFFRKIRSHNTMFNKNILEK